MKMNDNTILRIKVPAHLYEAVKAQLTLKEAKNPYGVPEGTVIKEKKTSDGAKKTSAPKNDKASKNDKAPVRVHSGESEGDNAPRARKGVPFQGMTEKKAPKKKLGLEELKAIVELLNGQIAQLEEKKEEKAPVEEEKERVEESMEYIDGQPKDATSLQAQMDRVWAEINKIDAEIESFEPILKTPEILKRLKDLNQRRKNLISQTLDIRDAMEKSNKPTGKIHQMRRR